MNDDTFPRVTLPELAVPPDSWSAVPRVQEMSRAVVRAQEDAEFDALVTLIHDAGRGGCGAHEGCRALVRKKERDAARRWFIDVAARMSPQSSSRP